MNGTRITRFQCIERGARGSDERGIAIAVRLICVSEITEQRELGVGLAIRQVVTLEALY